MVVLREMPNRRMFLRILITSRPQKKHQGYNSTSALFVILMVICCAKIVCHNWHEIGSQEGDGYSYVVHHWNARVWTLKPNAVWDRTKDFEFVVSGKLDSDHAKCPDMRKSVSG